MMSNQHNFHEPMFIVHECFTFRLKQKVYHLKFKVKHFNHSFSNLAGLLLVQMTKNLIFYWNKKNRKILALMKQMFKKYLIRLSPLHDWLCFQLIPIIIIQKINTPLLSNNMHVLLQSTCQEFQLFSLNINQTLQTLLSMELTLIHFEFFQRPYGTDDMQHIMDKHTLLKV